VRLGGQGGPNGFHAEPETTDPRDVAIAAIKEAYQRDGFAILGIRAGDQPGAAVSAGANLSENVAALASRADNRAPEIRC
jgi:hypothetical protein